MATTPSVSSLFGDILGPEQVRAQQEAEDLARGEFLAKNRGSAGALYRPSNVRNVARSVSGMLGLETRSPAEIKAEENKKLFTGLMQQAQQQFPNSRADQLDFVAQQLLAQGKTQESMKAQDAAAQARMQEAQLGSEQAQAEQRRAAAAASTAQAGKAKAETQTEEQTRQGKVDKLAAEIAATNALESERLGSAKLTAEQLTTEIQKRDPSISLIDAQTAANTALADQRNLEARIASTKAPLERNLLRAQAKAQLSGVKVDAERIKLLNSQVTTEQVKQEAERAGISETEARERLVDAQTERYIAMTPLEILKANTEIAKDNTQMKLDRARMADIGMTEFTRNLAQLDATEEEKQKLLKQYTESKAASGGVAGVRSKALDLKLGIVEKGLALAEGSQAAMQNAERMVNLIPNLDTGITAAPMTLLNRIGSELGVPSAQQATVANQLFDVLRGGSVLEAASNLKGALSDKDLKFLQQTVAGRELNAQVIMEAFSELYYRRYADQKIAQHYEKLLDGSDVQIRNTNLTGLEADLREVFTLEAKGRLALPVLE